MSQSVRDFERSSLADADLSAKQYYILKDTSTGVDLAGASSDKLAGVLQNFPASGEQANVRFLGTTKVKAGGTISKGDWITATTGGKAVATTSDHAVVIGEALEAAVDGDIFEMRLALFTLSA